MEKREILRKIKAGEAFRGALKEDPSLVKSVLRNLGKRIHSALQHFADLRASQEKYRHEWAPPDQAVTTATPVRPAAAGEISCGPAAAGSSARAAMWRGAARASASSSTWC